MRCLLILLLSSIPLFSASYECQLIDKKNREILLTTLAVEQKLQISSNEDYRIYSVLESKDRIKISLKDRKKKRFIFKKTQDLHARSSIKIELPSQALEISCQRN